MRNPLSQNIQSIKPSGIRKFFDIVSEMSDAISLGVGEPDFDTPWRVREEAIYTLEQGRTFYSSNSGLLKLREVLSDYLAKKYDIHYTSDEILVTIGGSEAIDLAFRAMLDPGDEVLIPQPCYVSYEPCTILAGGKPVLIPLQEKNQFRLTPEEIEAHVTDKTKIIVFPFPNNPTGAIMEREDLEAVCEVIKKHDLFVLTDEIYAELTYKDKHVSIASMPGMYERTVYINGFSKGFAMTGWRLGYACAPKEILSQMVKIHQFAIMCAPTTSQFAAIEALLHCDEDVKSMRDEYNKRRRYVISRLHDMGISCFEPFGAFYIFPSIQKFNMTSEEFANRLLNEQKVAVVPGNSFGDCGEGFLRISYAYSLEDLKVALDRIEKFVQSL